MENGLCVSTPGQLHRKFMEDKSTVALPLLCVGCAPAALALAGSLSERQTLRPLPSPTESEPAV